MKINEFSFYGQKSLENFTYTYQLKKMVSSEAIRLSSRINKLKGVRYYSLIRLEYLI